MNLLAYSARCRRWLSRRWILIHIRTRLLFRRLCLRNHRRCYSSLGRGGLRWCSSGVGWRGQGSSFSYHRCSCFWNLRPPSLHGYCSCQLALHRKRMEKLTGVCPWTYRIGIHIRLYTPNFHRVPDDASRNDRYSQSIISPHPEIYEGGTYLLQGPSTNFTKSFPESMTFFLTWPKNPTKALSLPPSCSSTSSNQLDIRFEKSVDDWRGWDMISTSWSSAPVARRYLFSPGCYISASFRPSRGS
jgi:hypothetical protein